MNNITDQRPEARQLAHFIHQHPRLVVLTGAGISLQSGIPTYRDQNGVWLGSAPMQHQDFINHEHTRRRYWARSFIGRSTIANAKPNSAHFALAELEQAGFIELLITQNVDNLHQQAGSQQVIDLHGNLRDIHCLDCAERSSRDELQWRIAELNPHLQGLVAEIRPDGDAILDDGQIGQFRVPECTRCGGVLMPEVVFFGGTVPVTRVQYCLDALQRADALLVVGSSLKVYSGFRFCLRAEEWGKPIALLNPGHSRADKLATLHLKTPSGNLLPQLIDLLALK